MLYVSSENFTEIDEKKSRFISFLMPVSCFENRLAELRDEHKKASHHVWAFRRLNQYDQIEEGASDDGEPSGTSGPPTLKVLQGNDLINTAVITVRYFGGTKLGTGGLVRAYSESAKQVIQEACLLTYVKLHKLKITLPFKSITHAEYLCSQIGIEIVQKDFGTNGAIFVVESIEEKLSELQRKLNLR
ncbi:YigZ family protein [Kiloniella sp. EL199]|uniref:IMPACT family protein n=1 Tax=Kiloniella sp. EL199 TaxID=2107581 RepID=UPI000EA2431E|nr:YigZ family protein [Kiloniella sp. EL199]